MNTERLQTLADFLSNRGRFQNNHQIGKRKFNLNFWMSGSFKILGPCTTVNARGYTSYVEPDNACETVGCAMGWATIIPEFRDAGLRLISKRYEGAGCWGPAHVTFNGTEHYSAAAAFFDISREQAIHLFSPTAYCPSEWHNPEFVVARIHELLNPQSWESLGITKVKLAA